MADDLKDMQRKLKEMEMKAKLEARSEKKKKKDGKAKIKLERKQEKMRMKMIKQGKITPGDKKKAEEKKSETEPRGKGEKISKAEVVEFKHEEWNRRSVHSIDEVEKKIDRFSGRGVKGLSNRYREKYGEDLKVPELYQIETSIEMEKDFDIDSKDESIDKIGKELAKHPEEEKSFFGRRKEKAKEKVVEYEPGEGPNFWDLSTSKLFMRDRFGANSGGAVRGVLLVLDIIILVLGFIPFTIIRLITTQRAKSKRKKTDNADVAVS